MAINPAFRRFPNEARLVGCLLAAFGELEVETCLNAMKATELGHTVLATLYRIRTTSIRLAAADALMRPIYDAVGLGAGYADAYARVTYCLRIRNQFAHCNWSDDPDSTEAGLFFADLTESVKVPNFMHAWKHVDLQLLESHEAYFDGALEMLRFMDHEMTVAQGRLQSHYWPKPPALMQPPLHNPEAKHIPPWLTKEEKDLHIARAQAAEFGDPTPTPAHLAMEAERARKRQQRDAHRARSTRARSDFESEK